MHSFNRQINSFFFGENIRSSRFSLLRIENLNLNHHEYINHNSQKKVYSKKKNSIQKKIHHSLGNTFIQWNSLSLQIIHVWIPHAFLNEWVCNCDVIVVTIVVMIHPFVCYSFNLEKKGKKKKNTPSYVAVDCIKYSIYMIP